MEQARAQVAALIGAEPREVVFTSGATESNNLAIKGAARHAAAAGDPRRRVVTVATEHKCVLESVADLRAEGFEPVVLPVRPDGLLEADVLARRAGGADAAGQRDGGEQRDRRGAGHRRAGRAGPRAGALFHTDAAQALRQDPARCGGGGHRSAVAVSGHKIYGAKGVGALYVRRRPRVRLAPLFSGGGQERGLRPGTLPVPLIVGLGEACRLAGAEMAAEARASPGCATGCWRGLRPRCRASRSTAAGRGASRAISTSPSRPRRRRR